MEIGWLFLILFVVLVFVAIYFDKKSSNKSNLNPFDTASPNKKICQTCSEQIAKSSISCAKCGHFYFWRAFINFLLFLTLLWLILLFLGLFFGFSLFRFMLNFY